MNGVASAHGQMTLWLAWTGSRRSSGLCLNFRMIFMGQLTSMRTLDMFQSFFTGYFKEGVQIMEMRTDGSEQNFAFLLRL